MEKVLSPCKTLQDLSCKNCVYGKPVDDYICDKFDTCCLYALAISGYKTVKYTDWCSYGLWNIYIGDNALSGYKTALLNYTESLKRLTFEPVNPAVVFSNLFSNQE
jgi:hypothetical protein